MSVIIAKERIEEEVEMRNAYCSTLMELAKQDDRIVVLAADLMKSMGMIPFKEALPERAFDVGVQKLI